MNQILLFESDFTSHDTVSFSGRRLHHVVSVHRAGLQETLKVGLLNGKRGSGIITAFDNALLSMRVSLDEPPPPPLPLTLVLSLPRPKTLKKVLHCVTAMGVKKIYLVRSWRVEKSYFSSPLLQPENIRQELILGLEQARDTILPEVLIRPLFKPFVEDELPAIARHTRSLVAHPLAADPCPRTVEEPVTLAIGPEGGFIAYEIKTLCSAGFQPITLGERILRVEHAVPAILGKLF
jgi:16S rRNA (uracil1498-N3)-methyltransferase